MQRRRRPSASSDAPTTAGQSPPWRGENLGAPIGVLLSPSIAPGLSRAPRRAFQFQGTPNAAMWVSIGRRESALGFGSNPARLICNEFPSPPEIFAPPPLGSIDSIRIPTEYPSACPRVGYAWRGVRGCQHSPSLPTLPRLGPSVS
jgi:hypothetical protein